ncbi:hypothetical protein BDZ94DRAFT_1313877 [Collybia nuda]|uniref:Uncharacterized protein n=1 Tax=Collybia nuda TaxID=64659 RepID=A0A9P6CD46_9AGAR|nr:hypothetical protein BDZ94DRAFT_1313877 [Collybia nuda]
MRSSIIVALFATIAAPMLSVAYPATQGRQELNLRALAEENSISARQITEAIINIFERSFDEGDLVRRAPPNGDCTSGMGQAGMTGPACAAARGHGWMSIGSCFSRQQMMMQGNVIKGTCYY